MDEFCSFPKQAKDIRCLLVINPRQIILKSTIEEIARKHFHRFDVVCPDDLFSLSKLVEFASKTYDMVMAGGGDGTLNRVIQALDREKVGLGVLPLGSGNDFARNYRFGKSITEQISFFAKASWHKVDMIRANNLFFMNSGGIGLDAETLYTRELSQGKFLRNYEIAFLRTIPKLQPIKCRVGLDSESFEGEFLWVLAMNNRWIGGGMLAAPNAKFDDGLLDVILVKSVPKIRLVSLFPLIYSGNHVANKSVIYRQAESLIIETEQTVSKLALDGELYSIDTHTVKFTVMKHAIWVFGVR